MSGSYTDDLGRVTQLTDSDAANYFGVAGPGVRTPGFWLNNNWRDFWDGDAGVPVQAGKDGFPGHDILFRAYGSSGPTDPVGHVKRVGILVGDHNLNGVTDNHERTIFYTVHEAASIMSSSSGGSDARFILDRALIATWLNYMAGNPLTDAANNSAVFDARDAVNHAINWLQRETPDENGDGRGDGSLTLHASSFRVASSSADWNSTVGGIPGGNRIKDWLDEYNNFGTVTNGGTTVAIAVDGDIWG